MRSSQPVFENRGESGGPGDPLLVDEPVGVDPAPGCPFSLEDPSVPSVLSVPQDPAAPVEPGALPEVDRHGGAGDDPGDGVAPAEHGQRVEALEDAYAVIKNKSETIQAMEYQPLFKRIKDYLLGLAAVAVVLMFVNMMRARIKAAREMRANMKKYKDSLNLGGKDDYPTI